ncbi:YicC/YloC family endoribonuclease [Thalassobacillus sp. CUG 92003]|uniref:YicC/YloC family endoribonuclease n=1 Tax=Thalassobacillus sp. CUG 92003 TaxID=2736641 RepID=UPI0015E681C7|nr:YicC/YloC family endoribonuclease [Thalassobacillus sp. CUG 92003]
MVYSMTGYGRETVHFQESYITVEVRSVNYRYLDISPKLPGSLLYWEERLKKVIHHYIHRGRVDIFVTIKGAGITKRALHVDWDVMEQYMAFVQQAKQKYDLTGDVSVDNVTKLEALFSVNEQETDIDELETPLITALERSMEQLVSMRSQEGDVLAEDLIERMTVVNKHIANIEERRPLVVREYQERIKARIEAYTENEFASDDGKVVQEVALLAEKGDVSEEITRLASHSEHFMQTIRQDTPLGRRLDFIVQEMHREVNTIGSKANDPKISEWVVSLKSELEKIKEQVQNIE